MVVVAAFDARLEPEGEVGCEAESVGVGAGTPRKPSTALLSFDKSKNPIKFF
jgi:hypothetical protein